MLGTDVSPDPDTRRQEAMALARSSIVPPVLRGSPENVLAVMYIASALDLPLATVWTNVYTTQEGDIGHRSRLLHTLLRRAGHRLVYLDLTEDAAEGLLWIHGQAGPIEVRYTMEQAIRLGLTEEWRDQDRHWQRHPENMLRNRLISTTVDRYVPEVKGGVEWSELGGLIVRGLAEGDEENARFANLGPEVVRLLELAEAIDADPDLDPVGRVTALRGVWTDARLLHDRVVDEAGTTLGKLIGRSLQEAKAAATSAAGGRKSRRKEVDEAVPLVLLCGCVALEVTMTGEHRKECASLQAAATRSATADTR